MNNIYYKLYQNAPLMYASADHKGVLTDCNNTLLRTLDYSKEELIGQPILKIHPKNKWGLVEKSFGGFLKRGFTENEWLPLITKSGIELDTLVNVTGVFDKAGTLQQSHACFVDLTKERKLQKQLKERNHKLKERTEELEQITYIASHDLRQPLRNISNFVGLLAVDEKFKTDAISNKYLKYIQQGVDRMKNLISSLLDYSVIGRKSELVELDLNELVQETLADLKSIIDKKNAIIRLDELPKVMGYEVELRLLFQNLIHNALKFTPSERQPQIKVFSKEESASYQIAVKDNGMGIEPVFHKKIFKLFQQLKTDQLHKGTGIGLAHCKKIAEMHGGSIWVESEIDEGSTFSFEIAKNL